MRRTVRAWLLLRSPKRCHRTRSMTWSLWRGDLGIRLTCRMLELTRTRWWFFPKAGPCEGGGAYWLGVGSCWGKVWLWGGDTIQGGAAGPAFCDAGYSPLQRNYRVVIVEKKMWISKVLLWEFEQSHVCGVSMDLATILAANNWWVSCTLLTGVSWFLCKQTATHSKAQCCP